MGFPRKKIEFIALGVTVFVLLLSLSYAVKVSSILEQIAHLPGLNDAPNEELRDDWIAEKIASRELEQGFQQFRKGDYQTATALLRQLLKRYPQTESAIAARQVLTQRHMTEFEKKAPIYRVKSGDTPLRVAQKQHSNLYHLAVMNGLEKLKKIKIGEALRVHPLDFHIVIDAKRKVLTLQLAGEFWAEFPIVEVRMGDLTAPETARFSDLSAYRGKTRVDILDPSFTSAAKIISLDNTPLVVGELRRGESSEDFLGYFLKREHMEQLAILTRVGNEVAIRR